MTYVTAFFTPNFKLNFGYDIYDRDAPLRRALHDIQGVGFPSTMKASEPELPQISRPKVIKKTQKVIKKRLENQGERLPMALIQNADSAV